MLRKTLLSAILILAMLGGSAAVFALFVATRPAPPPADRPDPPLVVQTVRVEPRTVVQPIAGFGTARPFRAAWIAPQVAGEVIELRAGLRAGAEVRAGELLVRIDQREFEQRVQAAQSQLRSADAQIETIEIEEASLRRLLDIAAAELAIAEREYTRVLALFETQQAPQRELDIARQSYESARTGVQRLENDLAQIPARRAYQQSQRDLRAAELAMAELDLERCRLAAPFDARIERVDIEAGERVDVGQPLLRLIDPQRVEVPIELPVSLRDRVAIGRPVRIALESNPQLHWDGRVQRISPSASENTRTFSLYIEVENRGGIELLPGMFVRATLDGPTLRDAIVVPRGAVQDGRVFVCEDGVARLREVRVDRHLFDQSVVLGLRSGDLVITTNFDALYDGRPVELAAEPSRPPTAESEVAEGGRSKDEG